MVANGTEAMEVLKHEPEDTWDDIKSKMYTLFEGQFDVCGLFKIPSYVRMGMMSTMATGFYWDEHKRDIDPKTRKPLSMRYWAQENDSDMGGGRTPGTYL
jgi:hypothetical protein